MLLCADMQHKGVIIDQLWLVCTHWTIPMQSFTHRTARALRNHHQWCGVALILEPAAGVPQYFLDCVLKGYGGFISPEVFMQFVDNCSEMWSTWFSECGAWRNTFTSKYLEVKSHMIKNPGQPRSAILDHSNAKFH